MFVDSENLRCPPPFYTDQRAKQGTGYYALMSAIFPELEQVRRHCLHCIAPIIDLTIDSVGRFTSHMELDNANMHRGRTASVAQPKSVTKMNVPPLCCPTSCAG